ncbi:MAG: PH domain-containing protein [Coriobacteriia bacterium]|nr:PH domain-containing protein [Coriobacteriia bacterium]
MRFNELPPEMYADEPVLVRTGPHWVSNDLTIGLATLVIGMFAVAFVFQPDRWWIAIPPVSVVVVRVGVDLPRHQRFDVTLTTRRLVLGMGMMGVEYHTINLRHVVSVEVRRDSLGRALGYGEVVIELEAVSSDGEKHFGTYLLEFVRDPDDLKDALESATLCLSGSLEG